MINRISQTDFFIDSAMAGKKGITDTLDDPIMSMDFEMPTQSLGPKVSININANMPTPMQALDSQILYCTEAD